jgi:hypothetical protein
LAGHQSGNQYLDKAPPGGLLVGLRCAKGTNWGGALQAVQPIYQVDEGYVMGARHGKAGGDELQLLAKPGYAVGAIHARAGLVLNALQLVFFRIDGRRLDPADRYESPWVGSDGGGPFDLDAQGAPITELFGTWEQDIVSLGVTPSENLESEVPLATATPPDLSAEPRPTTVLGDILGTAHTDVAPEGGVLVGLRAFYDESPQRTIRGLQPIYVKGDQYLEGQRAGDTGTHEALAIAMPGFIVSGIGFAAGGDISGVRLKFRPLAPAAEAQSQKEYDSPWLGYEFERPQQEVHVGDRVALGLVSHFDGSLRGIGLMLIGTQAVQDFAASPMMPSEYEQAAFARPQLRGGSSSGNSFEDKSPAGGLLVGLRLAKGTNWGGALQAVQPIYQVGSGYSLGQRHGKAGGDEVQVVAKPGYAVGAVHVRAGLVVNAAQISFYRLAGQRLDPADHYESPWVGSDGGGSFVLDAQGDPVAGVFGSWEEDLISLGISPSLQLPAALPLAEGAPPAAATPVVAGEFRRWKSADGKSTVEARLVGIGGESVQLERRDGKTVAVPVSRLSPADIAYLRKNSQ